MELTRKCEDLKHIPDFEVVLKPERSLIGNEHDRVHFARELVFNC